MLKYKNILFNELYNFLFMDFCCNYEIKYILFFETSLKLCLRN
jgi:hypothetical protein